MHIIIGLLTAIGTLVWALYRLQDSGVNLNAFNPFYWMRRKKWERSLGTKAMHKIENPMEAAALLVVGVASLSDGMTRELKKETIQLFVNEFGISTQKATDYYSASLFMLKESGSLDKEVHNILFSTKNQFKPNHIESLLKMLRIVSQAEGVVTQEQTDTINAVEKTLSSHIEKNNWK